ncbi:Ser/Thr protein phosphatase superfamily [Hypoxylon sp. FL1857]|nr:Ser/Thr protein phosphatase superfamily [Hypoxylon sp. FL1857]
MVQLQIFSDLHLENPKAYNTFEIKTAAPYLALLGDIGCVKHRQEYYGFLIRQLSKFRIVFLVMGNHEPWHSTWNDCKEAIHEIQMDIQREQESKGGIGELVVLDRTSYDIKGSGEVITILGCTLFSRVPPESMKAVSFGLNDFYYTEDWTVEMHAAEFERDLRWLNERVTSLASSGHKIIILTHYSPTLDERATDPKHSKSPIKSGFATDLSNEPCWLNDAVKFWAFGHTHFNCDFVDKNTGKRVVTNQRGYYSNSSPGFIEDKVITI